MCTPTFNQITKIKHLIVHLFVFIITHFFFNVLYLLIQFIICLIVN